MVFGFGGVHYGTDDGECLGGGEDRRGEVARESGRRHLPLPPGAGRWRRAGAGGSAARLKATSSRGDY